jgi:hypothetical protein
LFLYVFPTPKIEILASADVICAGDSVELHAVSVGQTFDFSKRVKIGDILCTDGSILDTADFIISGKTAEGVVFWISPDETEAWVVGFLRPSIRWSTTDTLVPGLGSHVPPFIGTLLDTAGYSNTLAIRLAGDSAAYPAAWNVDFDNGWFLPAAGQMRILHGVSAVINTQYQIAFGLVANFLFVQALSWTSTQANASSAVVLLLASNRGAAIVNTAKTNSAWVYPIRSIKLR